jgi:excisionase family DNA binding protein
MATSNGTPLLLRVEEVAELLRLGRSTVYDLIMTEQIPSIKVGAARRVPLAALEQWIRENTQPQGPPQ